MRILRNQEYRSLAIERVSNPQVKAFWEYEFSSYKKDAFLPIYNKVGAFLAYPSIRRVLIDYKEEIDFRKLMDEGRGLVVSLSKGQMGEDAANLLGSFIVNAVGHAAFSRADTPEQERRPFTMYLDEFHNFTGGNLPIFLSELRKYKVGLVLAHQYLGQISEATREAIFGNVGTIISFRLGPDDATYLSRQMEGRFTPDDFMNLPNYHIYLRLMIDGKPSRPFSATTIRFEDIPKELLTKQRPQKTTPPVYVPVPIAQLPSVRA